LIKTRYFYKWYLLADSTLLFVPLSNHLFAKKPFGRIIFLLFSGLSIFVPLLKYSNEIHF
jgi:hypothetical protein